MVDVFVCKKSAIYYNTGKKTAKQIKKETGCTHLVNGYLFRWPFSPLGWTIVNGKLISKADDRDWGFKPTNNGAVFTTDRTGDFLSGIPIIVNGNKVYRNLTPDVKRSAYRTAVGWTREGKIALYCSKIAQTREQLQDEMLKYGTCDCLMMDGGGSTQGIFNNSYVESSRIVPTFLLFWEAESKKVNNEENENSNKEEADVISVNVYNVTTEGRTKVNTNFLVREFKSDSKLVLIHPTLPVVLQMVRDRIGKPINITCAYRTDAHNARVGGASNSYHLYGMAADIYVNGIEPIELARTIDKMFPTTYGVICYTKKNFVHFDVRAKKYRAINNGTEKPVATF